MAESQPVGPQAASRRQEHAAPQRSTLPGRLPVSNRNGSKGRGGAAGGARKGTKASPGETTSPQLTLASLTRHATGSVPPLMERATDVSPAHSAQSENASLGGLPESMSAMPSLVSNAPSKGMSPTQEEGDESQLKWKPSCGTCAETGPAEGVIMHPDRTVSELQQNSLKKLLEAWSADQERQVPRGFTNPLAPLPASIHGGESQQKEQQSANLEDLQLPDLQASRFSQSPHRNFGHLAVHEMTRLEMRLRQEKVRVPMLAKLRSEEQVYRNAMRRNRENLELATLRTAAKRPGNQRSAEELRLLVRYLKNLEFFCELSPAIMAEVVYSVKLRRFRKGQLIFDKGAGVTGIIVILRGEIELEDFDQGIRGAGADVPLKVKFAADLEEIEKEKGGQWPEKRSSEASSLGSASVASLSPRTTAKVVSKRKVLGASELFEESARVYTVQADAVHSTRGTARTSVEALFLARQDIVPKLVMEARREKVAALLELFPLTKGKSEKDLWARSRVERGGKRELLIDLFELRGVKQGTVLFMQGERHLPEIAKLYFIVYGTAVMKVRGVVSEELTVGAMLGEEVLQKEAFAHTCIVKSEALVLLVISVTDYLTQFPSTRTSSRIQFEALKQQERRTQRGLEKTDGNPSNGAAEASSRAQSAAAGTAQEQRLSGQRALTSSRGATESPAENDFKPAEHLQQLHAALKGQVRRREDFAALMESEWQLLRHKTMPNRVAPLGGLSRSPKRSERADTSRGAMSARAWLADSSDMSAADLLTSAENLTLAEPSSSWD